MIAPNTVKQRIQKSKAILFDCDGVITDTMPLHCKAWQQSLKHTFNVDVLDHEIYKREGEKSHRSLPSLLKGFNIKPSEKEIHDCIQLKMQLFIKPNKTPFFEGILAFLEHVSKRFQCALVTGSERVEIESMIPHEIRSLFQAIVTSTDVSHGKPDPEPYQKALKDLNCNREQAIVIENAPLGIKSAKNAGLFAIALCTSLNHNDLSEADYVLNDHLSLYKLFMRKGKGLEIKG